MPNQTLEATDRIAFSERLRTLMREGETQHDFSSRVGMTQAAMSNYLLGRFPSFEILAKIHRATGADLNWLITGEPQNSQENAA